MSSLRRRTPKRCGRAAEAGAQPGGLSFLAFRHRAHLLGRCIDPLKIGGARSGGAGAGEDKRVQLGQRVRRPDACGLQPRQLHLGVDPAVGSVRPCASGACFRRRQRSGEIRLAAPRRSQQFLDPAGKLRIVRGR
jgi:hypothetical protein